jgi:uncharacterized membrane protein YkvA (DUF1232 family)
MTEKSKRSDIPPLPRGTSIVTRIAEQVRLVWFLFTENRISAALKALPVIAVVYLVSPLDFVPDIFPLLGWLDDVGIVTFALSLFLNLASADVKADHLRRMRLRNNYKVHTDKQGIIIDIKANPTDQD